jgi:hypothetical protein
MLVIVNACQTTQSLKVPIEPTRCHKARDLRIFVLATSRVVVLLLLLYNPDGRQACFGGRNKALFEFLHFRSTFRITIVAMGIEKKVNSGPTLALRCCYLDFNSSVVRLSNSSFARRLTSFFVDL